MNEYCIYVRLGVSSVSFLYYQIDYQREDRFYPIFEEGGTMPLAIWFNGSEIILGKTAYDAYCRHEPNAFYKLFEEITKPGDIAFQGEMIPRNKLIFMVMQRGLRVCFQKIFANALGRLEDNVNTVPLVISFEQEVERNKQTLIISQLQNSGFNNLLPLTENKFLYDCINQRLSCTNVLLLWAVGTNLKGEIYVDGHLSAKSLNVRDAARNPLVEKLVNVIWNRMRHPYMNLETEYHALETVAQQYISSGSHHSVLDTVILSNGYGYDYEIYPEDLNLISASNTYPWIANVTSFIQQVGLKQQDVILVLKESLVGNNTVMKGLKQVFNRIEVMGDTEQESMMKSLIEYCRSFNFNFPPIRPHEDARDKIDLKSFNREWRQSKGQVNGFKRGNKIQEAIDELNQFISRYKDKGVDLSEAEGMLDELKKQSDYIVIDPFPPGPPPSFKRDWHDVKVQVNGFKRGDKIQEAIEELNKFISRYKDKGVDLSEAEGMLDELKKQSESKPIPPGPPPSFKRDWREVKGQVNGFKRGNKIQEAIDELNKFISKYNNSGVDLSEAIDMLDELIKRTRESGSSTSPKLRGLSGVLPQPPKETEGDRLLKSGEFVKAKSWFRDHQMNAKADICSTLIRCSRSIKAYRAQFAGIKNARNLQVAKSCLNDLKSWNALYIQQELDTNEINELINMYKSIK